MTLHEFVLNKFKTWKPSPPEVISRSNRDVTLTSSAGPFSFLGDLLMYKIEKKDKIPPWIVVYSGGKTTKTIENLAPSHPHRFRMKVIIKSTSKLAAALEERDERATREQLNQAVELEHCLQSEGNNSKDNKVDPLPSHAKPRGKNLLSYQTSEALDKRNTWAESQWSDETWASTDSDGTSAVCFCMAVRCGYLKQVQQMLEERPSLVSVINSTNGFTPLATAVKKGDVNMVRFLLSSADIEQRSASGVTALHVAALYARVRVAEILLDKGADFHACDLNKLRVEHYAVDSGNLEVVKFVMDRGGDVGVRDSNGWTPLFRAVCQGARTDIIEELVRRGSDPDARDARRLCVAAVARLLRDRHGRRRESVLRLVDTQFQHEKVVANFTRLTKKISSVHTLLSVK